MEVFDACANVALLYCTYFPGDAYAPMRNCVSHYGVASILLLVAACREKVQLHSYFYSHTVTAAAN